MGKKRKNDSSDSSEDDKKKKKKDDKKKKKTDSKKKKEDKKKKDKKKTKGKKGSSSSSGDSGKSVGLPKDDDFVMPKPTLELPPPEEGILRFQFMSDEVGPLGLRFSGGFPPMILTVNAGSFAAKKGIPPMHEVHAINGLELVQRNVDKVMVGLKARPLTLDVRPQGWKPPALRKEMDRQRAMQQAERDKMVALEEQRRGKVAREQQDEAERQAQEDAEKKAKQKIEREALAKRAREAKVAQQAKEQEFEKALAADPLELRKLANDIMQGDYGADLLRSKRLPLRLFTRRKEVAWLWAGEAAELIGGGVQDAMSSWSRST